MEHMWGREPGHTGATCRVCWVFCWTPDTDQSVCPGPARKLTKADVSLAMEDSRRGGPVMTVEWGARTIPVPDNIPEHVEYCRCETDSLEDHNRGFAVRAYLRDRLGLPAAWDAKDNDLNCPGCMLGDAGLEAHDPLSYGCEIIGR